MRPVVEIAEYDGESLVFVLWIQPATYVRMTQKSLHYEPQAIKYVGWIRACAEAFKKCLRDNRIGDGKNPFLTGPLRLTQKFWISDKHRFLDGDLDNFTKGLKDMITNCARDTTQYAGSLAHPVWEDDKMVFEYGEGAGKFWEPERGAERTEVTIEKVDVILPEEDPKFKDIYFVEVGTLRFDAPRKTAFGIVKTSKEKIELLAWKSTPESAQAFYELQTRKLNRGLKGSSTVPVILMLETQVRKEKI